MNFCDRIIVLLKTDFREADRMVCVYSFAHGRMALRLPGVNKYNSRLKALSEPFVKSDARIYIRRNASIGCITGGKLESVHPLIRADAQKTGAAIYFCELFYRLTPEHSPNEKKFRLLEDSLSQLEAAPLSPAAAPAFLLRLMQLSGFGLKDMPLLDIPPAFWDDMHSKPLSCLMPCGAADALNLNKTRYVCRRFLNKYLQYPLNTACELDLTSAGVVDAALAETALEPLAV
ncbi:MAG: DNA repair protein RecO [Elusimicrobiota bacterium]|jgi:DNA repair protein RecO (recombination protein O)|nr:DNA repair protein RecO [Elusimicrobiota bacterium]